MGIFKQGDLAMVDDPGHGRRVMRYVANTGYPPCFHGLSDDRCLDATQAENATPLALLDPADHDQVERLLRAWIGARGGCPDVAAVTDDQIAALAGALRSVSISVRPAEPYGLGAVVEDSGHALWVRVNHVHWHSESSPNNRQTWGELDVVRVLSEGVLATPAVTA